MRAGRAYFSPEELAMLASIEVAELERIEAGEADPNWSTIGKLCQALGVKVKELAELEIQLREDGN